MNNIGKEKEMILLTLSNILCKPKLDGITVTIKQIKNHAPKDYVILQTLL